MLNVFWDIETFTFNKSTNKPSDLKSHVFSTAYTINKSIKIKIVKTISEFIYDISTLSNSSNKVNLYAHNANKYDNHFLLKELVDMGFQTVNLKRNNIIINENDDNSIFEFEKNIRNNECLEFRYRSSNRLSLVFKYRGITFITNDTFPKTMLSLDNIGKRLLQLKLIESEYLKTAFDYTKYDLNNDLDSESLKKYVNKIFNGLDSDEMTYIKNDVIILQRLVNNFNKFFYGFDVKEFAITGNVINIFTDFKKNKSATHHTLNRVFNDKGKVSESIEYSNYKLKCGTNLFTFFKKAYKGGVCYYNDNYLNINISKQISAFDINSSYPSILYKDLVPNNVISYLNNDTVSLDFLSYKKSNTFSIFTVSLTDFLMLIKNCNSTFKKIHSTYYKNNSNIVYLNSCFIDELLFISKCNIRNLNIINCVTFTLKQWGGRSVIKKYYEIKQNSKRYNMNELVMDDYGNITEIDSVITDDNSYMTDVSKIVLNSIYGASGINDYEDYFYKDNYGKLHRFENGIKNNERNIVTSLFITSKAKFNLLYPLKDLTEKQLADSFLYCDTDSLYVINNISELISENMILNDNNIGAWGCDSNSISNFKVLNHKVYAYSDNGKITCKLCGVNKNKVNEQIKKYNSDWDSFIANYFYVDSELPSTKSILNKYGTVSIYDSTTKLKMGGRYTEQTLINHMKFRNTIEKIYNEVINNDVNINDEYEESNNVIYYQINGGAYSWNEIKTIYNEINGLSRVLDAQYDIDALINEHYPLFLSKIGVTQ